MSEKMTIDCSFSTDYEHYHDDINYVRRAKRFVQNMQKEHIKFYCPSCGEFTEVDAAVKDFGFCVAPVVKSDDGIHLDIDFDDMDIEASWCVSCAHCGRQHADSIDGFHELLRERESDGHTSPFIDEAIDSFMAGMQEAYTPSSEKYVYSPDINVNISI